MSILDGITLLLVLGAVISFFGFFIGVAILQGEAVQKVPFKTEEFTRPYHGEHIKRVNERQQAFDDAERTTKTGTRADYWAKRMTFFGILLALLAVFRVVTNT